jgi:hypothetical protein
LLLRGRRAGLFLDPSHPPAAAAGDRLGEDREPDAVCASQKFVNVAGCRGRRENRHAGFDGVLFRGHLVARHFEHFGGRADEGDAGIRGCLSEIGVL